jgi:exodeoxyribonuclease III
MQTIVSWNVNGIRAAVRNNLLAWLDKTQPDILCVQETKSHPEQLGPEILEPKGYKTFWASAQKKGYSGVATFVKKEPLSVDILGIEAFDCEGRVQVLAYKTFTLINAYFPNSREAGARLDYKLDFCNAILKLCHQLRQAGKNLILCGDYNIAHKEIDLANPKANMKSAGFLPEERAWMDEFIGSGYMDTFRIFNPDPGHYTWWSYRFRAREKDIGWRVDYHCVNQEFRKQVKEAAILKDVLGSDHCPILLRIQ